MTAFIIIVLLAAAFAPIAYMMPSKRDRALADLRMIARREGLEVDVTRLPKLDAEPHERVSASGIEREATIDCVSYGVRLPKSSDLRVRYRLLLAPDTEWPVAPGTSWELDLKFKPATADHPIANDRYWAILDELGSLLPVDRLGLAMTDDFALFYWQERLTMETADAAAIVVKIRQALNKLVNHHQKYFAPEPTP